MDSLRPLYADALAEQLTRSVAAVSALPAQMPVLLDAADLLVSTLRAGGKVLTAGNGGSAAEAMHMAEELSGRYKHNRRSLPGLALTSDGTAMTCIGNDFGFDEVFARQVEGLGAPGDLLVLFSTSGKARNLSRALETARGKGMRVLALLGRDGGPMRGRADVEILAPGAGTENIQEVHQVVLHLLLEAVERAFPETGTPTP